MINNTISVKFFQYFNTDHYRHDHIQKDSTKFLSTF